MNSGAEIVIEDAHSRLLARPVRRKILLEWSDVVRRHGGECRL